jgi:hypothetical protein
VRRREFITLLGGSGGSDAHAGKNEKIETFREFKPIGQLAIGDAEAGPPVPSTSNIVF